MYMDTACKISDCAKRVDRRGWCSMHYTRWKKYGDPHFVKRAVYSSPADAFAARRSAPNVDGCRLWTGSKNDRGYGKLWTSEGIQYAHRFGWELENGPIPDGIHIDHICRNRACVEVSHLRLATNKQNHENLSGARSDSRSGIRGAVWSSQRGAYYAQVWHNGERHYGGLFADPVEAGKVAAQMRAELFTHH